MKQSASPEEAAAIAAAIERFAADESTPPPPEEPKMSPWTRAALLEGVSAQTVTIQDLEGGMR